MPWLAGFGALLAGLWSGMKDREIVDRMSDEDRRALEEALGPAEQLLADLRATGIAEQAGVPQGDFSSFMAPDPTLSRDILGNTLAVRTPTGETLTGTIGYEMNPAQDPYYFLNTPQGRLRLSQSADGMLSAALPGQPGGWSNRGGLELPNGANAGSWVPEVEGWSSSEVGPTQGQTFQDIFEYLRGSIPDTPSVMGGVDIPDYDLDRLIGEWETRFGGLLQRGDLVGRYQPAGGRVGERSLIPELPSIDFDATRASLRERLTQDTATAADQQSTAARRGLIEAGVLPGSAAFEFETVQAPRSRAATATAQGVSQIDADLEQAERELGFRRAEIEQTGLSDAARINAEIARTDATNLAQLLGTEEETIGNQFSAILQGFGQDTGFGLEGARLQLDANQQDIANDFQAWGSQFGVTQEQLGQFNTFLAQNAALSAEDQRTMFQLAQLFAEAEMQQADSTVLTNDIWNNALGGANSVMGMFAAMKSPDRPKSFMGSIAGTGLGWSS